MNAEDPHQIRLTINGSPYEVSVPARRTLVDMLRYDIGLTGTKEACSVGVCGACTVMIDGRIVASCITLAVQADGADITTIEGLGSPDNLSPLQQAFIDCGGFQCGICTPGQIVAATALLNENPRPNEGEIKEWLMGNLCRCTGYYQIIESVLKASGQEPKSSATTITAGQS
jgi:aerobic-type carbon monoxide dehydrogenase small subunit (CoxS/CutS family)